MLFLILFWLFLIVIACVIAEAKGRHKLNWAIVTLFLGVFGVILVACMSNVKAAAERAELLAAVRDRQAPPAERTANS